MRNLFEEFESLWPKKRLNSLYDILKVFYVLRCPEDLHLISKAPTNRTFIVVDELYTGFNPMDFFLAGFEHVLYSQREDFVSELLSSCWMSLRPDSFSENPVPFFFNGFVPESLDPTVDNHLVRKFFDSEEKPFLLSELDYLLGQHKHLAPVRDLCLQTADEMISNALYDSPVANGKHLYAAVPRNVPVQFPKGMRGRFFACFSSSKVIVGCEDPFGSIELPSVLIRLSEVYPQPRITLGHQEGAKEEGPNLGLKYMINNAANFYMYCEKSKKTVVACGFLLQGKKKNTDASKHLHISIR